MLDVGNCFTYTYGEFCGQVWNSPAPPLRRCGTASPLPPSPPSPQAQGGWCAQGVHNVYSGYCDTVTGSVPGAGVGCGGEKGLKVMHRAAQCALPMYS